MKPGSSVASPRSITVAFAGAAPPTAVILSPSTTSVPPCVSWPDLLSNR